MNFWGSIVKVPQISLLEQSGNVRPGMRFILST